MFGLGESMDKAKHNLTLVDGDIKGTDLAQPMKELRDSYM
jgi:hypothetical protein